MDNLKTKRFSVALSFPGEYRTFVEKIADNLAATVRKERILYDKYWEAEFACVDLDTYLPNLYRNESELVVIFLCPEYKEKRWCNLESRFIKQLIATPEKHKIMLVAFGEPGDLADIGILPGDGYIDIDSRQPEEIAKLILQRHAINHPPPCLSIDALSKEHHIHERGAEQEPFQVWENRAMVSLGPISDKAHCYFQCPFCYVNSSYLSFQRKTIIEIIDWLSLYSGRYDIVYISGDTDSFAGSPKRQEMAVELVEAISNNFHVEIMITTRAVIQKSHIRRLQNVSDKLRAKGLNFFACVSITQFTHEYLEPKPIPSVVDRISQLAEFKKAGMITVLAMRPFLPIVPVSDYIEILDRCKEYVDIVLGKAWYADDAGKMDSAIMGANIREYAFNLERMDFDTNKAMWKVFAPQDVEAKVEDMCDQIGIPFFMRSRPAIDWARANSKKNQPPRVIGIGALNVNFTPKARKWGSNKFEEGDEKEVLGNKLWSHVESSFGPKFFDYYEVFLGGGAYHAIECLSELDQLHRGAGTSNWQLEYVGVAGRKIEKYTEVNYEHPPFDIIERLGERRINCKFVKRSESKPGITLNKWSGSTKTPAKSGRTNQTAPCSNNELAAYLKNQDQNMLVRHLATSDWIHVSSLFSHEAMSVIAKLLTAAKQTNQALKISWDVGVLNSELCKRRPILHKLLHSTDFVLLSPQELRTLAGISPSEKVENQEAAKKLYKDIYANSNFALVVQDVSCEKVEFYWRYKESIVSQKVVCNCPHGEDRQMNVTAASAYLAAGLIDSQIRPDLGFNMRPSVEYGMNLVWAKLISITPIERGNRLRQARDNFVIGIETSI
ncbi:MAG: hypothetical protein A2075_12630 [Geobacteraceae bacterium GWC2_58_44]|nr:MAG: hypothetical protein A2075_12630 [Geobacteraceae bacterium GWC2_58_44]